MRFVEHPFTQLCSPCGEHVNADPDFVASAMFTGKPCVRCGASDCRPDLTEAIAKNRRLPYDKVDKQLVAFADKVSPKIFSPKEESQ